MNFAKYFLVLFFCIYTLQAFSKPPLELNGAFFYYPDSWKEYSSAALPKNTKMISKVESCACILQSLDLQVNTSDLDYAVRLSMDDWMLIYPNLAVATDLTLIFSGHGFSANGRPLFIGTFSFFASNSYQFVRTYLAYTGTKMINAYCFSLSSKSIKSAQMEMQDNISDIHFIGSHFE